MSSTAPQHSASSSQHAPLSNRRSLRSTASASSLPRLSGSVERRSQGQGNLEQPTLAELVQAEEQAMAKEATRLNDGEPAKKRTRQRRRSSAPLPGAAEAVLTAGSSTAAAAAVFAPHPPDDFLLPPHFGRPARPSSPDVLATLLRPVLASLSRPASPAASPLNPSSPVTSHPSTPPRGHASFPSLADAEPADCSASSLPAHFPPREPTDPAPPVESQGFVLYVGSLVAYVAYLAWAFLPGAWLEGIGVGWYPSQEWALLVPAWVVMLVAFTYSSYFFLNMRNTPPLDAPELFSDGGVPKAFVPPPPRSLLADGSLGPSPLFAHAVSLIDDAIPPLYDMPQEWVDRVLYGLDEGDEEG
ncbi:hypothetical protein JCM10207_008964 [Rhodosporidiobolus poonsookiae]